MKGTFLDENIQEMTAKTLISLNKYDFFTKNYFC